MSDTRTTDAKLQKVCLAQPLEKDGWKTVCPECGEQFPGKQLVCPKCNHDFREDDEAIPAAEAAAEAPALTDAAWADTVLFLGQATVLCVGLAVALLAVVAVCRGRLDALAWGSLGVLLALVLYVALARVRYLDRAVSELEAEIAKLMAERPAAGDKS